MCTKIFLSVSRLLLKLSAAQQALMAKDQKRLSTLKDEQIYRGLLRAHVKEEPSHSTQVWHSDDYDLVVSHFAGFPTGMANTGQGINETVLAKWLKEEFKTPPDQLKLSAHKMSAALSWCRVKAKSVRSGSKTNEGVLQVVNALRSFKSTPSSTDSLPSPATPAKKRCLPLDDDAASAYQHLQDAFGGASAASAKPLNAHAIPSLVSLCDSPALSVASSAASPQAVCPIAKQVPFDANHGAY